MIKFTHYLTKPFITRIIVSLIFKNGIIMASVYCFQRFYALVKYEQILSLFNQAYYYSNYCVFNVFKLLL